MRCSNCSETVSPVVALDIDGTLGNYHEHFELFASAYLYKAIEPEDTYDGSMKHSDWFCKVFDTDITTFRSVKLAYRQGGMKRLMEPYVYARELVNGLKSAGAEVWLTTTRPWERYDRVDPDTREWLRRNGIVFDGLIYDENKMDVLADRVDPERVCFVLDDLTEELFKAHGHFGRGVGVLRRTEFNAWGPQWSVIVSGMLEARAVGAAHIQDWNTSHNFDDLPTTKETP